MFCGKECLNIYHILYMLFHLILMTYLSILLSPVEVPEMQLAAKRIIERLRCDAEQFQEAY